MELPWRLYQRLLGLRAWWDRRPFAATSGFGIEKDFFWDDAKLNVICHHYGTGSDDVNLKGKKQVAWMDVCEDLGETDASFKDNPYAHGSLVAMEWNTDAS